MSLLCVPHCHSANLEVIKKLEGNLSVTCQSLTAQMLHGNSVDISAESDVSIQALYSVNSAIQSASGSVCVNLSHGHSVVCMSVIANMFRQSPEVTVVIYILSYLILFVCSLPC
jgi:hypothetical protein